MTIINTVPTASADQIAELHNILVNRNGKSPLASRFRALFTLRSLASEPAVSAISEALRPTDGSPLPSALLGHELAYCLGQIGRPSALPVLGATLADLAVHPMVRHEAAEAMGAISDISSIQILKSFLNDPEIAVRETCELAIGKIEHDHHQNESSSSGPGEYGTVDPAPSMIRAMHDTVPGSENLSEMRSILLDRGLSLFQRYRAMFGLRDAVGRASGVAGGEGETIARTAVDALAAGFADESALFRHEIAYVFGQLSHPASVPALLTVLKNGKEDEMVRHEAAEALGSIATPDVLEALKTFASIDEPSRVVRESCEVALDMYDYENSTDFQYALPLNGSAAQSVVA
ncbi:armadillo-type protein [Melampsora americana]|nr:armadillo-type protein [Melampsora americana]